MRISALFMLMLGARFVSAQDLTPLACVEVIGPSDSGAGRFGTVAEGPDGRLAYTEARATEFLLRDAQGKVRTVGRYGSGPGDFQRVARLGWFGDTVWATDGRLPRVSFFSDTGRLLRVETATPQVAWLPRPGSRLVGLGWMPLGLPTWPPSVVVTQVAGELKRDTIKLFVSPPVDHFALPPRGALNPQPFAFRAEARGSPSGSRFCGVRPEGSLTRVECIDDQGGSVLNATLRLAPRPLTAAVYDSMIAVYARAPGRTEQGMRDLIERPRNLPPVMDLMVDPSGGVWLQRSHDYEPIAHWTRLRADGAIRDEVRISKRYRVITLDVDSFWAATADSDGLETLHKCRIGG